MRRANRIFDVLGSYGVLHLHLTNTKFPVRYLVGPQALVSVTKIRSVLVNRNMATRANTDTRLDHNELFNENARRKFATI